MHYVMTYAPHKTAVYWVRAYLNYGESDSTGEGFS